MNLTRQLKFDRHSLAELRAMDGAEMLGVLDELFGEFMRLNDLKSTIIDARAAAKIEAIDLKILWFKYPKYIQLDADLQKLITIIGSRKEQAKLLQTKINASVRI